MRWKEEAKLFSTIWRDKQSDLKQWFFYNVLVALCPIWLAWVTLAIGLTFNRFHKPLIDGTILIFAVTLSGASLAFFAEETRKELRETKRFLLNWLLVLVLVGAAGYSAIVAREESLFRSDMSYWVIAAISLSIFLAAIALNLHLAAVRLALNDEKLVAKLLTKEREEMSQRANTADSVDNIKL